MATAFNPHMFRLGGGGGSCSGRQQPGAAAAADGEDAQLTTLFALGSQDHGVTVWKSNQCRPLVCGKKLFKAQVVDVAWTPDGYGLLACSSDGARPAVLRPLRPPAGGCGAGLLGGLLG